jgi:AmmeMemoRadiSam system protein A
MELSVEEKRELLRIARASIEAAFLGKEPPEQSLESKAFREAAGAFVTLKIGGELRGCIGYIEPRLPLVEAVREVAQRAAFSDPRFPPLSPEELGEVDIEISVLSPVRKISDVHEIEVGKHGLIVEAGNHRGLLLPQVALEHGWDRETFLRYTCVKAGLPESAWTLPQALLSTFTTTNFSEAPFQHAFR